MRKDDLRDPSKLFIVYDQRLGRAAVKHAAVLKIDSRAFALLLFPHSGCEDRAESSGGGLKDSSSAAQRSLAFKLPVSLCEV